MITAQMATLPERAATMQKAVASILPQVDRLRIMLNNYTDQEGLPDDPKIEYHIRGNEYLDGEKFYKADTNKGITVIVDDDILYPPDFVKTMIAMMNFYRLPFVTVMGKILRGRPLDSYYHNEHICYRTFEENRYPVKVDIPGTCGTAYRNDYCNPSISDMKVPNSDVCVAVYLRKIKLLPTVIPHPATWLTNLMPELPEGTMTIFDTFKDNDKEITNYINGNLP